MQLQTMNLAANDEFARLKAIDLLKLSQEADDMDLEYRDTLNLERKVRFGVELEYEGVDKTSVENYIKNQRIGWASKTDETLKNLGKLENVMCVSKG